MSGERTSVILCGPGPCPNDPAFEHDNYFGCIPSDFSASTGRSKKYRQTRGPDGRYYWNGGCKALDLAALRQPAEQGSVTLAVAATLAAPAAIVAFVRLWIWLAAQPDDSWLPFLAAVVAVGLVVALVRLCDPRQYRELDDPWKKGL